MKIIPIDGDKITVEQLCRMLEDFGGYFDGDKFAIIYEEKPDMN